jgi:uncharacterized membrane protein
VNDDNLSASPPLGPSASPPEAFDPHGRRVPARHGVEWIRNGWRIFRQRPGVWIGLGLIYVVLLVLLGAVPLLNLLTLLLGPVLMGGAMFAYERARTSGEVQIGDLFAGFRQQSGQLVIVGLLALALTALGSIVLWVTTSIPAGDSVATLTGNVAFTAGSVLNAGSAELIGIAVYLMIFTAAIAATWFAPALVMLHNVAPYAAMKASLAACVKNWLPLLVYSIVLALLMLIASIPFGLGLLVMVPVMLLSIGDSYRDIFVAR